MLEAGSAPSFVELTTASDAYGPGDQLTVALRAFNSPERSARELYSGVVLPDGHTLVHFTGTNVVGGVEDVSSLAGLRPLALLGPGELLELSVLAGTLTGGLPQSTYTWFAFLVTPGALARSPFDPGDLDVVALRSVTFLP